MCWGISLLSLLSVLCWVNRFLFLVFSNVCWGFFSVLSVGCCLRECLSCVIFLCVCVGRFLCYFLSVRCALDCFVTSFLCFCSCGILLFWVYMLSISMSLFVLEFLSSLISLSARLLCRASALSRLFILLFLRSVLRCRTGVSLQFLFVLLGYASV